MKSDFKKFQKLFTAYQKQFGLNGYYINFKHALLGDVNADITIEQEGAVATVRLNTVIPENADWDIRMTAKHEAIHLLLGRFAELVNNRYITKFQAIEAEEELVRRLTTLISDIKD